MLPALEGEIRLKDESAQTFDQVVANAMKANQALKGSQAEVLKLEEVFSRLNVKPASNGGFMDVLSGKSLQLDDVLMRALNADNMGAATYRELAGQIKTYVETTEVATNATSRLAERLESLGPPKLTAFDKLDKRLQDVKKGINDLEKDTDKFKEKMDSDAEFDNSIFGKLQGLTPETEIGGFLQNMALKIPGVTKEALVLTGALGAVAAGAWAVNTAMESFLGKVAESEIRAANMGFLSVRIDTTQLERDFDNVQTLLDRRISEEELGTIMLKIDPRDALSGLDNFSKVAKTVQSYADEFGLPWKQALDQVTQAIGKGDGAFLQQQGYIWDAQKAYLDYAGELGKNVAQLTSLERQQALVNAVLKENKQLLDETASNADIARGANERFAAQLADIGTGLLDLASAWAENRVNGVLNWFADDGTLGPGMAGIEKFISEQAGNERIRAQLNDAAEASFDGLLKERDRVAASITDLTAELPKAQAAGDQKRVDWLTSNIDMLEGRLKAIDVSVGTAREDVFAGRPVTPLIAARDEKSIAQQSDERQAQIAAKYDTELAQAKKDLAAATDTLTQAEKNRRDTTMGPDQNRQMTLGTYSDLAQRKRDELAQLDAEAQRIEQSLVNAPKVPYDMTEAQGRLSNVAGQVGVINGQLAQFETRIVQLNNSANLVNQITGLTEKIKQLQQSGGSQADIDSLIQQRAQSLQNFMELAEKLNAQGIVITAPDMPIEEVSRRITEQTTASYKLLEDYKASLKTLQGEIGRITTEMAKAPTTNADPAYVEQLNSQLTSLKQKRQQMQNEITQIEQQLDNFTDTESPAAVAALETEKQAQQQKAATEARVQLLEAEKNYLTTLNNLQEQAANGNTEMWEQAAKDVEAAQKKLSDAYSNFFASNATNAESLVEAQQRLKEQLGEGFLQDLQSGKIPILDIFKTDDLSEQTQKRLGDAQKAFDANPVSIPVKLGDATITREDALKMVEQAQSSLKTASQNLTAAYASGDDTAIAQGQANRDAAVAMADQAIAILEYTQSVRTLNEARQSGIESAIAEAEVEVSNSLAKYEAASASVAATQTKVAETQATGEATNAALGQAAALELIKIANEQAAQAQAEHATIMEGTAMVAGILVDAVSGLPLAFNAAELNAAQLQSALVSLETQMGNIENAAISAGFSIANRLIPVMGLAGSLQQAGKFAQQARGVSDTFNQVNQNRMAEGQTPLGPEVLNASMDALKQSWNAMATDSVAAMRKVETAGAGGASAMEQAVKRMDTALDNLVQGVLQDSTKGLIPVDDLLPREDAVDEKARRMADVAVKGYKSPWFEGLRDMFPDEILNQGEGKVKESAARMVRDHQQGLTTMFYDTEMAADKVLEQIQAKADMGDFVAQVREKVKEKGANVEDLDIMEALGIDVSDQKMAGAAASAQRSMSEIVPTYEEIINQIAELGEAESPLIDYLTPSEDGVDTLKTAGTDAASTLGEEVVRQATEGAYGTRAIDAIINQMTAAEERLKKSGKDAGNWWGTALTATIRQNTPQELLDILIVELIPLMTKALAAEAERGGVAP